MPHEIAVLSESLEGTSLRRARDAQDMLGGIAKMAQVAPAAFKRGAAWLPPNRAPKYVVIVGMGGSAISGDLARTLLSPLWRLPVFVCRQPTLPTWVNGEGLAIFLSYSGQTAETLAAFEQSRTAAIPAAAVTVGGQLGANAVLAGVQVLPISEGWPPRAALGELYFTLLGMLFAVGAPIDPSCAYAQLAQKAIAYGPEKRENLAKRLALSIFNAKYEGDGIGTEIPGQFLPPAIFGVSPSTEAVALRWKSQLNENSKTTALYNVFPELTHNEIVNLTAYRMAIGHVIVLRDPSDAPMVRRQIDCAVEIIGGGTTDVVGEGEDPLARQLSTVILGDFVSVYLALLRNVDPTPVDAISRLKTRMIRR